MLAAVHQFHSGTAVGDAVTNQMLDLQRRLRRLGFVSDIYAQHIAPELAERIMPLDRFVERPSSMLLVHHSMGHTAFDQLMAIDTPMVTVFHSITPEHFFEDADTRHYVRVGFRQLRQLARRSRFGIADSNHNRRQMYDAGFVDVDVMPVRTDFSAMRTDVSVVRNPADWLFVGRVVPNKRQVELVEAFAAYRATFGEGHLHLVGDVSMSDYVARVLARIHELGVGEHVTVHGKVSDRRLVEIYRSCGLFVCLSEHEGFGVPLLEAMAADLAVVAVDDAAVGETLGGAGVLLSRRDAPTVAAAVRMVRESADVLGGIVAGQQQRIGVIEQFDVDGFLQRTAGLVEDPSQRRISVQIQGPFETSYSLAVMNRMLALELARRPELDVSIYATEGPGDYEPDPADLARHPEAAALYGRAGSVPFPDVVIRQMFPPRVNDSTGGLTLQYFGWEESLIPPAIADDFNRYLDGIGVTSTYVETVLRDSGVVTPIAVVSNGVDEPGTDVIEIAELRDLRRTRFLHISSAFPRKGVDVLLAAYFDAFTGADDVSLVLKTFPNPHNEVAEQLNALRASHPNPPHLVWIDRDLDRRGLDTLYRIASAYVHTARGEGFGLPVAEAMLASVPVISVDSTGLADFVNASTARVIAWDEAPARAHVSIPGSTWAEPRLGDVTEALREFVQTSDGPEWSSRCERAREHIARQHSWEAAAERWVTLIGQLRRSRRAIDVVAVSTFNSRCGIAEYSASLYEPIRDRVALTVIGERDVEPVDVQVERTITRAWWNHRQRPLDELIEVVDSSDADVVHVQYNYGFFEMSELERLIESQSGRRPVVVTLHRTSELREPDGTLRTLADFSAALRRAGAVIVHQAADRARLAEYGVTENVVLMLHGNARPIDIERDAARARHGVPMGDFVIGSFGFLLPHKGMLQLLEAVRLLRQRGVPARVMATTALHPDPGSAAHLAEVRAAIERLGLSRYVDLHTDFLPIDRSRDLLACSDVIVMPYEATEESASGAIRSVLPLGRAIVTSDLAIFDDVRGVVAMVDAPVRPEQLADLLEQLWVDDDERARLTARIRSFAEQHSWPKKATATEQLYRRLIDARDAALAEPAR